jgi:hypothetical protein
LLRQINLVLMKVHALDKISKILVKDNMKGVEITIKEVQNQDQHQLIKNKRNQIYIHKVLI